MNDPKWKGVVRHILTLIGTVLVAFGWFDQETVEQAVVIVFQLIGAVLTAYGFIRSWKAPEKNKN